MCALGVRTSCAVHDGRAWREVLPVRGHARACVCKRACGRGAQTVLCATVDIRFEKQNEYSPVCERGCDLGEGRRVCKSGSAVFHGDKKQTTR
jgi:hypothetical protein